MSKAKATKNVQQQQQQNEIENISELNQYRGGPRIEVYIQCVCLSFLLS